MASRILVFCRWSAGSTGWHIYSKVSRETPVHRYLEVVETNSVVVEISKLFLVGEQICDKLVNVNQMSADLEGSVVVVA